VLSSHLVLGGVKSGKSRFALALAARPGARGAFVATALGRDPDMAARIARHRAERPAHWRTVEEHVDVAGACRRLAGSVDVVVVDCLTLWVAARMERGEDDTAVLAAAGDLAGLMAERLVTVVIVSNEVGQGVHPPTAVGLRFADLLGLVNQRIASAADRVTLMVAGIPVLLQDRISEGHGRAGDTP
jgi:adenosyl cobinamide kinase/adenosyl cobinamide phosphate guanylyltransferase